MFQEGDPHKQKPCTRSGCSGTEARGGYQQAEVRGLYPVGAGPLETSKQMEDPHIIGSDSQRPQGASKRKT